MGFLDKITGVADTIADKIDAVKDKATDAVNTSKVGYLLGKDPNAKDVLDWSKSQTSLTHENNDQIVEEFDKLFDENDK